MRRKFALLLVLLALAPALLLGQAVPYQPAHGTGASVTAAFEGWFRNQDGTFSLLLGYYNRNQQQEIDVPIGPNNHIEPGGPDRGQPTHFLTGRGWGMFTVKVPADFGETKLTWTITANGQTTSIPVGLKPDYEISPLMEASVGNTPPVLRFEEQGPSSQGPQGLTAERTAQAGKLLDITLFLTDDGKFTSNSGARPKNIVVPMTLKWSIYRGIGKVSFSDDRPTFQKTGGSEATGVSGLAKTLVTFDRPGDYTLHVTVNDYSGEGGSGFQCCWSNGFLKVIVQK